MPMTRRRFLGASATAGALLVARPHGVLAQQLPSIDGYGTARESRLFPGTFCVHTDMHNHSLLSDGDGDPANFFGLMRESGIDVASLTDHSVITDLSPGSPCGTFAFPGDHTTEGDANELSKGCQGIMGLDEGSWERVRQMADASNADGDFAAIAGFEWSSPTIGHVNVWFSRDFTDPLHTGGLSGLDDALLYAQDEGFPVPADVVALARTLLADVPAAGDGISAFQDWLKADPGSLGLGGGNDAIFGFNHPGREPSRFEEFSFDADLVDRAVSMELFNKTKDYLFELTDSGRPSPLVACLDAGWRPGIIGTSDYHGTDWGTPDTRGRSGMFVSSLSRDTVRGAMEARRFFAARVKGLRLDATANGVRMGSTLGHRAGRVHFKVDVDRGPAWVGKHINIQVLQTGSLLPTVVASIDVTVPGPTDPVISFNVPVDVADGEWVVLRFTDPEDDDAEKLARRHLRRVRPLVRVRLTVLPRPRRGAAEGTATRRPATTPARRPGARPHARPDGHHGRHGHPAGHGQRPADGGDRSRRHGTGRDPRAAHPHRPRAQPWPRRVGGRPCRMVSPR